MADYDGDDRPNRFSGTSGDDTINGFGDNDILHGLGGADRIDGGDGDDTLFGGSGDDTLLGGNGTNILDGGAGADRLVSAGIADRIDGGAGDDYVTLTNTAILGGSVTGGTGGFDRLYFDSAIFDATSATASLSGFENVTGYLFGTMRGDAIDLSDLTGTDPASFLTINGGDGSDRITGGSEYDYILGGNGNDTLNGGDGDDYLYGGTGANRLNGGGGNDAIYVESIGDRVDGGSGNDFVQFYGNAFVSGRVVGGDGFDTLSFSGARFGADSGATRFTGFESVTGDLFGDFGDNVLDLRSLNRLTQPSYLSIYGAFGVDTVFGGDETDNIVGNDGDDILSGGRGDDILYGNGGGDTLTGGAGADRFGYITAAESNGDPAGTDTIADFSQRQGDRIDLSLADADPASLFTDETFVFIGTAAFSDTIGELRFEISNGATFVEGDTDGDGQADLVIELNGAVVLTANDFVL